MKKASELKKFTKRLAGFTAVTVALSGAFFTVGAGNLGTEATSSEARSLVRFLVEAPAKTLEENQKLASWLAANGFDVAGTNWRKGEVEVITDEAGIEFIRSSGRNGRALDRRGPTLPGFTPDSRYFNPDKLAARLQQLSSQYPDLTRLEEIGRTTQNRPIHALLLSTTPGADDPAALQKPTIIFDGLHHAREIMTTEIVEDVAEVVLSGYSKGDAEIRDLLSRWQIWVVPMLNVDGSTLVWNGSIWWRKNARAEGGSTYGVDINRNYPYRWGDCNGSSGNRKLDDYRGASPGSEPETQAMLRLANKTRPTASLSYHSYSELVLYPYGCSKALTGENALVEKVAKELAAMLPTDADPKQAYTPGAPWQILYAVDGDSMSDVFSRFGTLAYTFEVNTSFQPKYDVREPTLLKHRKAWKYFLNRLDRNLLTVKVLESQTGQPVPATISVNSIPHNWREQPFRTNDAGVYFKVLDPGNAVITAKTVDGRTASAQVQMAGTPQQLTLQVR